MSETQGAQINEQENAAPTFGSAQGELLEPLALVSDDLVQDLFMKDHKDRFLYNSAMGGWMVYENGIWRADNKAAGQDALLAWLRKNLKEVINKYGPPRVEGQWAGEHYTLAARYSSDTGQKGVLKMATHQTAHHLLPTDFDKDRHLLNTPTCVVDLKTGERITHDPRYFMTRRTSVGPSNCSTPVFDAFLNDITLGNGETKCFLQTHAGYCLTGETKEQKVFFAIGGGGNGKGVLFNAKRELMGSYARTANAQILMSGSEHRHTTDIADLAGARAVFVSELPSDAMWSQQRLTGLTGGDKLSARFMYRDNFEYDPQFKLVLSGNRRPAVQNPDPAFLRRMLLVRFNFMAANPDAHLSDKLRREYGGILQWAINGAVRYYREGLKVPASITAATHEYAAEEDDIGQWLEECCMKEKNKFASARDLFQSYSTWAEENGSRAFKKRALGERLRQLGFAPIRHQQQRGYLGLHVVSVGEKLREARAGAAEATKLQEAA
jgi:putative DNA primase/helicase